MFGQRLYQPLNPATKSKSNCIWNDAVGMQLHYKTVELIKARALIYTVFTVSGQDGNHSLRQVRKMQTSLLLYPRGDRFIRIHTSMLFLCEGNQTAAALISFLEYWHNIHQQRMEYDSLMNSMLRDNDQAPIIEVGGWQFHTDEQLQKGVMIAKRDTIVKAATYLEEKKQFISSDVPDRLKMLYKTGRTKWFLLMADRVNKALADLEAKQAKLFGIPAPPIKEKKEKLPTPEIAPTAEMDRIICYYNKRRAWAADHFRKETAPTIKGTVKRYMLIIDRLKTRSLAEICLAIEGCMKSDFHQGSNDRKTVYDEFERILKSDEEIDKFMKRAIQAGVNMPLMESYLSGKAKPQNGTITTPQMTADMIEKIADAVLTHDPEFLIPLPATMAVMVGVQRIIEARVGMFTDTHRERLKLLIEYAKNK